MSFAIAADLPFAATDSGRPRVLRDLAARWRRFTSEELAGVHTNDELVGRIVAKYGVNANTAQRDVDTVMNGRNLSG